MPVFNWRHLFLTAGLLLFFAGASWAQVSTMEGEVKGEDGKPVQNAVIKIERKDIKGNYQVKTNKKGQYLHAGLPLGTYKVTCEVGGQTMDTVDNVRTKLGDSTKIDFNLAEAKARAAAAGGGAAAEAAQDQTRGMSAEQKKQLEEANKKRAEQLSKNKALNDAFNAGMAAKTAKQWDAAIDAFNKAIEVDPKQHVIWANLAESLSEQAATKPAAEQAPIYAKAVEDYQKAIELKPDDAAYHNNYGLALARAGKFPEAQAELGKAADIDKPNAGRYYYNLGAILVNTGHSDEAYEAFKKATDADPNYADAYYQIGLTLLGKASVAADGKITPVAGTAEAFQKYLQLAPNGANADAAKSSLQAITGTVQTEFGNKPPAAKKKTR